MTRLNHGRNTEVCMVADIGLLNFMSRCPKRNPTAAIGATGWGSIVSRRYTNTWAAGVRPRRESSMIRIGDECKQIGLGNW